MKKWKLCYLLQSIRKTVPKLGYPNVTEYQFHIFDWLFENNLISVVFMQIGKF